MTALPDGAPTSDDLQPVARQSGDTTQPRVNRASSPAKTSPQPVHVDDQGKLHLEPPAPLTADQIVLLAEIRSLLKRVEKNRFWARQEIYLLLEDAATAGIVAGDVKKGASILQKAADTYLRALLARNRIYYVVGTAVGVMVLVVLALGVVLLAEKKYVTTLADSQIVVALFAFAGIGSATSVLIRLSTLDLKEETTKKMLILSGASKPLVAIAFASIVYIVLKYQLVAVSIGKSDSPDSAFAGYCVAAFLCGFSERFGSDIIARLEPKGNTRASAE